MPRAEFFFNQSAQFKRDERGKQFAGILFIRSKYLIARLRFFKQIPNGEFHIFQIIRKRLAMSGVDGRNL